MIQIRKATRNDWRWIHHWENFESLWEVTLHPGPFTTDDIIQFLDHQNDLQVHGQERWLISLYQEPIGMLDLFEWDISKKRIGIGIAIPDPDYRRRGYATKSLKMAIKALQSDWDVKEIFCNIQESNRGSLQLFGSIGFKKVNQKIWNGHHIHELSLTI